MTTYTLSDTPVPATRGRPLSFTLRLRPPSDGAAPINLTGAQISAYITWSGYREDADVEPIDAQSVGLSWDIPQLIELPVKPAPRICITIVDTLNEVHDVVLPVATSVLPS